MFAYSQPRISRSDNQIDMLKHYNSFMRLLFFHDHTLYFFVKITNKIRSLNVEN